MSDKNDTGAETGPSTMQVVMIKKFIRSCASKLVDKHAFRAHTAGEDADGMQADIEKALSDTFNAGFTSVSATVREMQKACHQNSRDKGWWDECSEPASMVAYDDGAAGIDRRPDRQGPLDANKVLASVPEKLVLIHSEISEALEDFRDGQMVTITDPLSKPPGKFVGFGSEIADVVIRCFDLCGALGIDLQAEIEKKHAYNQTRAFRHGGKRI